MNAAVELQVKLDFSTEKLRKLSYTLPCFDTRSYGGSPNWADGSSIASDASTELPSCLHAVLLMYCLAAPSRTYQP